MDRVDSNASAERRVLLLTDYALLRDGLLLILQSESSFVVKHAPTIAEAVRCARKWRPHVVLTQPPLCDGTVLDAIRGFLDEACACPVIVMSVTEDPDLFLAALRAGARGFLGRNADAPQMVRTISDVMDGHLAIGDRLAERLAVEYVEKLQGRRAGTGRQQAYVTERELQVLYLLSQGMTNGAIARELFLSENTVRAHVRNIVLKLDAENRVQAVARAVNLGLLTVPSAGRTSTQLMT
ncbi:MAG: LuxR C-terminal-related transcriptional regulator [Dehalococcoidia bacterium]